jgi:hypothetical protein
VSYGVHHERVVLFKTDWFKSHESDIKSGKIEGVPQKWVKVEYGGGGSPFPTRKERVIGTFYYVQPEGYFFDPPGHCFCFSLDGHSREDAGKLLARIAALRKGNPDPQSYRLADAATNNASWIDNNEPNNEVVELRWEGQAPPQGLYGHFLKGLFGLAGALATSEGMRSPEGLLPNSLSSLRIYLTDRRLIIEAEAKKELEVADFPVDGVRALQWNMRPNTASLEIVTDGPWTQSNSTNQQQRGTPGTGPAMNLPTRHLAEHGGWDGFLTGHYGRHFVAFDPRGADVKNMVETLTARFKNRPPPLPAAIKSPPPLPPLIAKAAASAVCLKCGTSIIVGAKFCGACGAPVVVASMTAQQFCSKCGTKNDGGAKFCKSCGKPFVTS